MQKSVKGEVHRRGATSSEKKKKYSKKTQQPKEVKKLGDSKEEEKLQQPKEAKPRHPKKEKEKPRNSKKEDKKQRHSRKEKEKPQNSKEEDEKPTTLNAEKKRGEKRKDLPSQKSESSAPKRFKQSKIEDQTGGFEWDNLHFAQRAGAEEDPHDESVSRADGGQSEKEEEEGKKRAQNLRRKEARMEEQVIAERERELLSSNVIPESAEDFERLLIASPNSSYLWIQFMAFKLGLTDIEGARKIAERALKTINMREEQERFNIYAAMMNLEAKFGNEQSQKAIFERARTYCRPKPVFLQQAKIYEQNNDLDGAEKFYQRTVKKFNKSRKCWEAYETFELQRRNLKRANEILERSLLSLPKEKHIKAIIRFSMMHYKHGSVVQANKLLESIVQSYPSRTDVWSLFIDAELQAGRIEQTRNLFARVCALKLSTKKMKSFLQRFLKFEQQHGTEKTQEHVKDLARQYITSKTE